MARAAIAAGADGVIVEMHPNPDRALSDGAQSLHPDQFRSLVLELRKVAEAIGRRVTPTREGQGDHEPDRILSSGTAHRVAGKH
jgi:3-deoxy-7-phosphoheptulonate synthase